MSTFTLRVWCIGVQYEMLLGDLPGPQQLLFHHNTTSAETQAAGPFNGREEPAVDLKPLHSALSAAPPFLPVQEELDARSLSPGLTILPYCPSVRSIRVHPCQRLCLRIR